MPSRTHLLLPFRVAITLAHRHYFEYPAKTCATEPDQVALAGMVICPIGNGAVNWLVPRRASQATNCR